MLLTMGVRGLVANYLSINTIALTYGTNPANSNGLGHVM